MPTRGHQIPASVWMSQRMREPLLAQPPDFGAVIRALQQRGISQQDIAEMTSLHQATVSKVALGRNRLTDIDKIINFLAGLGVPQELSPVVLPGARGPLPLREPPLWDRTEDLAADLTSIMASNTTAGALDLAEHALHEVLAAYEADGPTGPMQLARRAVSMRHTLIQLTQGYHPASVRTQLFRLLAQVHAVLGYMAVNAGQHDRADAYCRTALTVALDVADTDTLIWIHGTRSFNDYYKGDYQAAAAHAQQGIALAPQHPQAVRLYTNGLARAQAKLGNPKALDSVQEALRLTDRHGLGPELTPCISLAPYGRARTLANALTVHVLVGDGAGALRREPDVAAAIRGSDAWSRALVGLDIATAQLACDSPEVEQAMALGGQVIADRGTPMIASIYQRCHDLYERACQSWADHPAVRDYGEALHHLDQSPEGLGFRRPRVPTAMEPSHGDAASRTAEGFSRRAVTGSTARMSSPT
ncbi:hypothetical protein [Streptomyces sp. DT195]|uniref:hypothetical protein n=1 Tax=Streptomyces sp. DT195 TaxID=3393419 RepID=UPI003CE721EB